jgi:hypothetical protein
MSQSAERNLALFSNVVPNLQLVWDATTLKDAMTCPTLYHYKHVLGWRGKGSVDAEFGQYTARGRETYRKGRLNGQSKEAATFTAIRTVLSETQDWEAGGRYTDVWRCTGTTKYKNAKGNKAKCPWSHKGVFMPGPAPDVCGTCGSPTETMSEFVAENPAKNRRTLIRSLVWWTDDQPKERGQHGLYPISFDNGTPAVELSYQMPLPIVAKTGERFVLAGYLGDSISEHGGEHFVTDDKTTKNALDRKYFSQYSPNIQVDVYDLAGTTLFPDLGIKGVAIEGSQLQVGGVRFGIGIQYRTDALREELIGDLEYYLNEAEKHATAGKWPKNRAACFLCAFKGACNAEPEQREVYLRTHFEQRHWDPLSER